MKNHPVKPIVGKWQFVNYVGYSPKYLDPFTRQFVFGIIKFKAIPCDAMVLNKKYYKGFMINIIYKLPIAKG